MAAGRVGGTGSDDTERWKTQWAETIADVKTAIYGSETESVDVTVSEGIVEEHDLVLHAASVSASTDYGEWQPPVVEFAEGWPSGVESEEDVDNRGTTGMENSWRSKIVTL